jgi:hypothetical protein
VVLLAVKEVVAVVVEDISWGVAVVLWDISEVVAVVV